MALWYLGENHAADNILIADSEQGKMIALIERKGEPFKGCYAFPGGFVDTHAKYGEHYRLDLESPYDAAIRELKEEVSVELVPELVLSVDEVGFYNDRGRDPRNTDEAWVASTAFLIGLSECVPLTAADDAASAEWKSLKDVIVGNIELAFDHRQILDDALAHFPWLNDKPTS